jgi:hypothetical protein
MSQDLIRYDLLTQEALRGVVRSVLADVAKAGLPGDHHFFIAFATQAPGVRVSKRLRETYPEEMTIVLQYQFWDLEVTDGAFAVSLSFNGIPERLHVPFAAIKGFFDPSVQFGLQFDPGMPVEANDDARPEPEAAEAPAAGADMPADARRKRTAPKPKPKPDAAAHAGPPAEAPAEAAREAAAGADVVSLDAFRKKT